MASFEEINVECAEGIAEYHNYVDILNIKSRGNLIVWLYRIIFLVYMSREN